MKLMKFLLVLMIFVFATSLVSAQEGNFTELQSEIDSYGDGDTLVLDKDFKYDNDDNNLVNGVIISHNNFILDGDDYTIDGNGQARIFQITGDNVTIRNLNLINGFTLSNGGAIYSNNTNINIKYSYFENNSAKYGGAVYSSANMSMEFTDFFHNSAEYGGAVYSSANMSMEFTDFFHNSAEYGGAVYSSGNLSMDITDFLINSANYGGAIYSSGNLEVYSNDFINNSAKSVGGAIYSSGKLFLNETDFAYNIADMGGALFISGKYYINDGIFLANDATWGSVYISRGEGIINNSTFFNTSAKYSTAIHNNGGNLTIYNSSFSNLIANQTAGAIGIKDGICIILDSNFTNTKSTANGGAIFTDSSFSDTYLIIDNSNFINCSSGFGGAIVALNTLSGVNISDSNFINNLVEYDGGAIYASFTNIKIIRSNFTGNKGLYDGEGGIFGGALYLDMSDAFIENSTFLNNGLESDYSLGGAIYSYDSSLLLNNNVFKDNIASEGSAIFSYFDEEIILNNNEFNNDTISTNNTYYVSIMFGEGAKIELINNSLILENLPFRFDLRDFGWISPVKNQGSMGACWAFGTLTALKSALLKSTGELYDFSENNLQNAMLRYSIFGDLLATEGGFSETMGIGYLLNWFGPLISEHDSYDELGKISPLIISEIYVQDLIIVPPRENSLDNDLIKDALIKYGALSVGIHMPDSSVGEITSDYFNSTTGAFYYYDSYNPNHQVTVVGWDDNYSKYNFVQETPGDGAFIVQNSWGEDWGDKGYFYVSYYDTKFCYDPSVGFIFNNTIAYNKNYQYDWTGKYGFLNDEDVYYYANQFEAYGNDLIAAIGTYFEGYDNDYELFVYVNDELKHSQVGKTYYPGFSTIQLDKYIPINDGDLFKVIVKSKTLPFMANEIIAFDKFIGHIGFSRMHLQENTSFWSIDGENWEDMLDYNATACLKVYTVAYDEKEVILEASNFTMYYKDGSQFIVSLFDSLGNPLDNKTINITINGVSYLKKTNKSGIASLNINLNPGNYSVSVFFNGGDEFNNASSNNYVIVNSTILSKDLVKYYKNGTQFDVTVFGLNGDVLADVNVTFNINGVIYTKTTNSSGVARLNINLNPGNYTITTSFNGLSLGNNIEVKQTVFTSNLVKTFGNNETYDILVLDGQGNPLKNVTVEININGVFYYRITGDDGIAKLNINLNPGSYIATVNYNEYATSNNVTVKS
ncbi:C1 family peptidase [Methanobrevibacter sp. DSM 116169]|uniref:C1 family peptidase n=1 Tax=Methanobrevibacter sp. DSM 116169 TaxID=3242727 RepID=UPI0038FCD0B7